MTSNSLIVSLPKVWNAGLLGETRHANLLMKQVSRSSLLFLLPIFTLPSPFPLPSLTFTLSIAVPFPCVFLPKLFLPPTTPTPMSFFFCIDTYRHSQKDYSLNASVSCIESIPHVSYETGVPLWVGTRKGSVYSLHAQLSEALMDSVEDESLELWGVIFLSSFIVGYWISCCFSAFQHFLLLVSLIASFLDRRIPTGLSWRGGIREGRSKSTASLVQLQCDLVGSQVRLLEEGEKEDEWREEATGKGKERTVRVGKRRKNARGGCSWTNRMSSADMWSQIARHESFVCGRGWKYFRGAEK